MRGRQIKRTEKEIEECRGGRRERECTSQLLKTFRLP